MRRLSQKQKYILVGVFIFAILLLIILDRREHYDNSNIQFNLPFNKINGDKNGDKSGFKDDFILDFSTDGIDELKNKFTTKSYSGVKDNSNCDKKNWSGKPGEFDPTCGNVAYIDEFEDHSSSSEKLISIQEENNKKYLELKLGEPSDTKNKDDILNYLNQKNTDNVYPSIRLTSNDSFDNEHQHLFILKAKLPFGNSLWPAWWLTGTDDRKDYKKDDGIDRGKNRGDQSTLNTKWPTNGEIDIIELVNDKMNFKNVLHMCNKCKSRWKKGPKYNSGKTDWGKVTQCQGEWGTSGCFSGETYNIKNDKDELPNSNQPEDSEMVTGVGNLFHLDDPSGVFACWWNPKGSKETIDSKEVDVLGEIRFYYWKYNENDLNQNNGPLSKNPDPSKWDKDMMTAVQYWKGEGTETQKACKDKGDETDCNFNNLKMVFNTTLCGDWAGNAYAGGKNECINNINKDTKPILKQKWKIDYIAAFWNNLENK